MQVRGGPDLMQLDRTMFAGGIAVLVISLLVMQWNQWWAANLLTNFHLHLAIVGLVVGVAGALWRRWFQAGIGVAIIVANLGLIASQLPSASLAGPISADKNIRVMTLNVLYSNSDVTSLRQRLVELSPDVALLQEVSSRWDHELRVMDDLYPYRMRLTRTQPLLDQHGTVVLSRFPFIETARPDIGTVHGQLTAARVAIDGQDLWVASTHLVKPSTKDGQELQKLQLRDLAEWVERQDGPLVLGGDFNSTLYTPQMERLVEQTGVAADMQATPWWRVPFGTYPAWLPVFSLKIDHIMTRGGAIRDVKIVEVPRSDHRGVIATISLPVGL